MNMMTTHPPLSRAVHLATIALTMARDELEDALELMVAQLDGYDDNEDVPDFRPRSDGAPGMTEDAEPDADSFGDPAWIEWLTRGRHKLDSDTSERLARSPYGAIAREDDEDDDPKEEDDHAGGDVNDADEVTWLESVSQTSAALTPLDATDDGDEPQHVPADMHGLAAGNDA